MDRSKPVAQQLDSSAMWHLPFQIKRSVERPPGPSIDSQELEPHSSNMKMTFTLPDGLARQFQSACPPEQHSQVVAGLLARKLRADDHELAKACRGANRLKQVEKDMEDWESLNLHDQ